MEKYGILVIKVFDDMGIIEVRLCDSLLCVVNVSDVFEGVVKWGNEVFNENIVLVEEVGKWYGIIEL